MYNNIKYIKKKKQQPTKKKYSFILINSFLLL